MTLLAGLLLGGYGVTIAMAALELRRLRGAASPDARRARRRALGAILTMSAVPLWIYQNELSTPLVALILLLVVSPGLWLYMSSFRREVRF